jgi:FkbM family methyltransferase
MSSSTTLTLVDGVHVVVPDSLNLITPYVLREQQDWFEDEIKFLRRLLQPGQKVIDIGANYGVYTLSMARAVGAQGRVWAFEPASVTADFLARGIAANGFDQVVLERSALSSAPGTAQLSLNDNAEFNELVRGDATVAASETVPLVTLDDCLVQFGWQDIAFMKIDAEGEEANILKGGRRFFDQLSPLVEYEVKAGNELHLELVEAFAALGYQSYRLVPGLDLLVPVSTASTPDAYLLNLFCCKPDRAAALAAAGFLVPALPAADAPAPQPEARHGWRQTLATLPYGQALAEDWDKAPRNTALENALALHAMSQDTSLSASERFHALEAGFHQLQALCAQEPAALRRASLARMARSYGARVVAVNALAQLSKDILQQRHADGGEPFLTPTPRFDHCAPAAVFGNWILGATLEAVEQLSSLSSFYTGATAKQRLEAIVALGFASEEMQRRLALLKQRLGAR